MASRLRGVVKTAQGGFEKRDEKTTTFRETVKITNFTTFLHFFTTGQKVKSGPSFSGVLSNPGQNEEQKRVFMAVLTSKLP